MSCRADLAAMQRLLRRKLDLNALSGMETALRGLLDGAENGAETTESSANDTRNERHHNTDSDLHESEKSDDQQEVPPLAVVLKAAPEIETYATRPIEDWRELSQLADFVRPMMGITTETWQSARRMLGERRASIALACILQRFSWIRNPGAYLRRLSRSPNLDVGPMVMALLHGDRGTCPS
jgi:replication initiation protein RepC